VSASEHPCVAVKGARYGRALVAAATGVTAAHHRASHRRTRLGTSSRDGVAA